MEPAGEQEAAQTASEAPSEPDTAPNALCASPANDPIKDDGFVVSDENLFTIGRIVHLGASLHREHSFRSIKRSEYRRDRITASYSATALRPGCPPAGVLFIPPQYPIRPPAHLQGATLRRPEVRRCRG
jgi:hypothetical protein